MTRVAEERLDPGLAAVVVVDLVLDEQLAEQDPHAEIRERAERKDLARSGDHLRVERQRLRVARILIEVDVAVGVDGIESALEQQFL